MAFVSDTQLARIETTMVAKDNTIKSLRQKLLENEHVDAGVQVLETVGAGMVAGAARGKFEDANGAFNIPHTSFDVELGSGLAALGIGFFGRTKKAPAWAKNGSKHLLNIGAGIMAHYGGQVARNSVKKGSFTMIAGRGDQLEQLLRGY